MLIAFIDDSAAQTGDKRLVLAGYLSRSDIWRTFEQAWRAELACEPALPYLHMVEAANFRGPFSTWTSEDRDSKILALARLIRDFDLFSFECSVSLVAHRALFPKVAPFGLAKPFSTCAQGVASTLARHVRNLGSKESIHFVFDTQQGADLDLITLWDWMRRSSPRRWRAVLGPAPRFADDRQEVALQAADMLAWHRRRAIETGERPDFNAVADLLLSRPHLMTEIDQTSLETMAAGMQRVPGLKSLQSKAAWRELRNEIADREARGLGPPRLGPRTTLALFRLRDGLRGWFAPGRSHRRRERLSIRSSQPPSERND